MPTNVRGPCRPGGGRHHDRRDLRLRLGGHLHGRRGLCRHGDVPRHSRHGLCRPGGGDLHDGRDSLPPSPWPEAPVTAGAAATSAHEVTRVSKLLMARPRGAAIRKVLAVIELPVLRGHTRAGFAAPLGLPVPLLVVTAALVLLQPRRLMRLLELGPPRMSRLLVELGSTKGCLSSGRECLGLSGRHALTRATRSARVAGVSLHESPSGAA